MNVDSRGVFRGGCTECGCTGYDGGTEKKKCVICFHPPGKHKNFSTGQGSTSTTSGRFTAGSSNYTGGFQPTPSSVVNQHSYERGLHRPSGSHVHHHYDPRLYQPQLQQCEASGCFTPVHYDPSLPEGLRMFSYCSPECRDRHLLPQERANLMADLRSLKKKLQEAVAADKMSPSAILQRQSSFEHSSSRVGGSTLGTSRVLNGCSSEFNSSTSVTPGAARDGHHSTSSSPSSPSGSGATGKQPKEQKTSVITFMKRSHEQVGVLLSKMPYTSDEVSGFLVVGVLYGSPAYVLMQNGKIRLLDVIKSVSIKSFSELLIPEQDPQLCFDQHLKERTCASLCLSHVISLPPISDLLIKASKPFTHLITLRYSPLCSERAYGLTLNSSSSRYKVVVGGVTKGSPAHQGGVKFADEVVMYAAASLGGIDDVQKVAALNDSKLLWEKFDELQSSKQNVILMIYRLQQTAV